MSSNNKIEIRSQHLDGAEISWFAPLCSDDYEFWAFQIVNTKVAGATRVK